MDAILVLHRRIQASGFGRLLLPPATPLSGPMATIHIQPHGDSRTNIEQLLFELVRDYDFRYRRDQLELTYEHKQIVLARVTFLADAL
jgi:hypothetical protein